ncbi:MAG: branched chain amino acid aminotransferase, partial [Spirochaetaceae bacterium]|nr:branched chain amino acid aminotransferase [Spirochaetaceae bacterium]
ELARERGIKTSERRISIDEAMSEAKECFVSGTAAAATPVHSLTYRDRKAVFNGGKDGELTLEMLHTLKGIQYGIIPDTRGWMFRL